MQEARREAAPVPAYKAAEPAGSLFFLAAHPLTSFQSCQARSAPPGGLSTPLRKIENNDSKFRDPRTKLQTFAWDYTGNGLQGFSLCRGLLHKAQVLQQALGATAY